MTECLFDCFHADDDQHHLCFQTWLANRFFAGYDTLVHVIGDERGGKSGFVCHTLCSLDELEPETPGGPRRTAFQVHNALAYDWDDLNPLLRAAHDRFVTLTEAEQGMLENWVKFWLDEATNVMDALDWNKVENKATKKLFRQWGYLRALTFAVDPDGRLDRYVMSHRAKVRVIMDARGVARVQIQQRDRNRDKEPWYKDSFTWRLPDPRTEWPQQWNGQYTPRKLDRMGLRIGQTADLIDDARRQRETKRLENMNRIRKLESDLGIAPRTQVAGKQ